MGSLHEAIFNYQTALDQLPAEKTEAFPSLVLHVLTARDRLAQALAGASPTDADLNTISALDQHLQARAPQIDAAAGRSTLASWRESAQPPASAWWWRLDERAAAAEPKPSPLWAISAAFFITVAVSLTAEIARRFLTVGPDFIGTFSTLIQAFLALVAGRSLTDAGQHSMERTLARFNINRKYAHVATTVLALTLLMLVAAIRLSLPTFARYYNNQGVSQQMQGKVTSAIQDYRRATSLNPNYAEGYYNLATAYEQVLAYDLATSAYQTALLLDSHMYAAYNNLARVYLLQNNFGNALPLLDTALDLPVKLPEDQLSDVHYSMLKNRGWANLGLKYYSLADSDLRQALELRPDGAAAHCLLAQVLEAENKTTDALPEWEACLRFANSDVVPVEARWVGLARERLSQGTQK